jgi:hypothetical protein
VGDNGIIINPNFKKMIEVASSVVEILLIGLAVIFSLTYLWDLYEIRLTKNYTPIFGLPVLFALMLFFNLLRTRCNKEKKFIVGRELIYAVITITIVQLLAMLLISRVQNSMLASMFLPEFMFIYVNDALVLVATSVILSLSLALMLGIATAVRNIFYETFTGVSLLYKINSSSTRKQILFIAFMATLLISTLFVFKIFGDNLWVFSMNLLDKIGGIETVLIISLLVYYIKTVVSGSEVLENPENTLKNLLG